MDIYYQNTRGVNTKNECCLLNSLALGYSIIALSETWLNDSRLSGEFFDLNKYSVIRRDRCDAKKSRGGGVLLAVLNECYLRQLSLPDLFKNNYSMIGIIGATIKLMQGNLNILVLYIPPKVNVNTLVSFLEDLAELVEQNRAETLILGDFNAVNYVGFTEGGMDEYSLAIVDFANLMSLEQYNNVKNGNNHLLDLVLFSSFCSVSDAREDLVPPDWPHHPSLIVEVSLASNVKDRFVPVKNENKLNFNKAEHARVKYYLSFVDWSPLLNISDVNEATQAFYEMLFMELSNCVPRYKVRDSKVQKFPCWFDDKIIKDLNTKYKYWKLYKKYETNFYYNQYCCFRELAKLKIKQARNKRMIFIENKIKEDPAEFWNYLGEVRATSCPAPCLKINNHVVTEPQVIVDEFAGYFSSVYDPESNVRVNNLVQDYVQGSSIRISSEEVLKALQSLPNKKSSGPDGLPTRLIKHCHDELVFPLMIMINLAIKTGVYPELWKQTRVIPVFKSKGSREEMFNPRPVSLISGFSKVFEKCLYPIIMSHFNPVASIHQHGFMKGRSTTTNLAILSNYIHEAFKTGAQVDVIYSDFQKAFDKFPHDLLIDRLADLELPGNIVRLIKSYLHRRENYVEIGGFESYRYFPSSGVPQGSSLGPLLFFIFINKINKNLDCNILLFADDVKIFLEINQIQDAEHLQENLTRFAEWCKDSRLKFAIEKWNVMSFSGRTNKIIFNYVVEGTLLPRPEIYKDLGVHFTSNLSFKTHVDIKVSSAAKALDFVTKTCKKFTKAHTVKLLYYTYVRSKLEYASIICPAASEGQKKKIEKIQRRLAKFLYWKKYNIYPERGYDNKELLKDVELISLEDRAECMAALFCLLLINGVIDSSVLLGQIPITDLFKKQ